MSVPRHGPLPTHRLRHSGRVSTRRLPRRIGTGASVPRRGRALDASARTTIPPYLRRARRRTLRRAVRSVVCAHRPLGQYGGVNIPSRRVIRPASARRTPASTPPGVRSSEVFAQHAAATTVARRRGISPRRPSFCVALFRALRSCWFGSESGVVRRRSRAVAIGDVLNYWKDNRQFSQYKNYTEIASYF